MSDSAKKMAILDARDQRVLLIERLLPLNQVILSLRVNYPGDDKDNEWSQKLIQIFDYEINKRFKVCKSETLKGAEGPTVIYLLKTDEAIEMKHEAVHLEASHPLGRFVDIDVYYESLNSLSRRQVNIARRCCYLCDLDAAICMRQQNHSLKELTDYIKMVVDSYE